MWLFHWSLSTFLAETIQTQNQAVKDSFNVFTLEASVLTLLNFHQSLCEVRYSSTDAQVFKVGGLFILDSSYTLVPVWWLCSSFSW